MRSSRLLHGEEDISPLSPFTWRGRARKEADISTSGSAFRSEFSPSEGKIKNIGIYCFYIAGRLRVRSYCLNRRASSEWNYSPACYKILGDFDLAEIAQKLRKRYWILKWKMSVHRIGYEKFPHMILARLRTSISFLIRPLISHCSG